MRLLRTGLFQDAVERARRDVQPGLAGDGNGPLLALMLELAMAPFRPD